MENLFFSPNLLINSIICLYQYGLYIYFILWVIIQYYFIVLLKLFWLWPLGALSFGTCVSDTLLSLWDVVCIWPLPYFPTIQHAPGWSYRFLAITLECHFSKEAWSFYWQMVLEIKIWVLDVLVTAGVSLLLGPLSWQSKEICVYTNPHISTCL